MARKSNKAPAVTPATPAVTPNIVRSEVKASGTPKTPAPRAVTREMIAARAYEIYAGRGYAPGDSVADWYEAERQLRAGL